MALEMQSNTGFPSDLTEAERRRLYEYVLRTESRYVQSFWDNSSEPLLQRLGQQRLSVRVIAVCRLVPSYLDIFFDILLRYAPSAHVCAMVPVLVERLEYLFAGNFKSVVTRVLIEKTMKIFAAYPPFVVSLKSCILDVLSDPSRDHLPVHLCYVVGEYLTEDTDPLQDTLHEYYQSIELLAFELLSMARQHVQQHARSHAPAPATPSAKTTASLSATVAPSLMRTITASLINTSSSAPPSSPHAIPRNESPFDDMPDPIAPSESPANRNDKDTIRLTRLLVVTITTLAKLATRFADLKPRVNGCLRKIVDCEDVLHKSVIARASECARLLKDASTADVVFARRYPVNHAPSLTVDSHSAVAFMLQSRDPYTPAIPLHPFQIAPPTKPSMLERQSSAPHGPAASASAALNPSDAAGAKGRSRFAVTSRQRPMFGGNASRGLEGGTIEVIYERTMACIRVQAWWRAVLARREVGGMREGVTRHRAVVLLQRVWLRALERRNTRVSDATSAVLTLQTVWRRALCRKQFSHTRERERERLYSEYMRILQESGNE